MLKKSGNFREREREREKKEKKKKTEVRSMGEQGKLKEITPRKKEKNDSNTI